MPLTPLARPRIAAGALFLDDQRRVLLVRPTYKDSWDIPGGYVEPGESPLQACIREVREELGISPPIGRLLVVDWAPSEEEGDKILFVFDGGQLDASLTDQITLETGELSAYSHHAIRDFSRLMTDRLTHRIASAVRAAYSARTHYLEYGRATECEEQ